MPIEMACPQCSAHFNFADDWAGKRARCQRCQTVFLIDSPAPPSNPLDVPLDLELVDEPPAKSAPPQLTLPEPEPPPPTRKKPALRDTTADDFDVEAYGGLGRSSKTERPAQRRQRGDDEEEERPERKRRGRREEEDDEEDRPAFSQLQRDRVDAEERGTGTGIRGGKYPFLLKFVIFVAVLVITGGSKMYWLKDRNEEQGTFAKMKKTIVTVAIIFIVFMVVACGGLIAFLALMRR